MQCIHNYIPETNQVLTLYNVAAILLLQYMAHVMLFPTINLLSCTSALSAVCVQCPVWLFCLVPWYIFLSRYVAQVISEWFWDGSSCPCYYRYHFWFAFQMCCIYIVRSLYSRIFSASLLITFLSPESATCIIIHVHVLFHYHKLWCPVYFYGLFCRFALVYSIIWLPYLHGLFLIILVHAHISVKCLILPPFPCICYSVFQHTMSCLFVYCSFASIGEADKMWSVVFSHLWYSLNLLCFLYYYYYYYLRTNGA